MTSTPVVLSVVQPPKSVQSQPVQAASLADKSNVLLNAQNAANIPSTSSGGKRAKVRVAAITLVACSAPLITSLIAFAFARLAIDSCFCLCVVRVCHVAGEFPGHADHGRHG